MPFAAIKPNQVRYNEHYQGLANKNYNDFIHASSAIQSLISVLNNTQQA